MGKLALMLVYVFSPVDLMPELVLGPLGLGDDALVVLLTLRSLVRGGGR